MLTLKTTKPEDVFRPPHGIETHFPEAYLIGSIQGLISSERKKIISPTLAFECIAYIMEKFKEEKAVDIREEPC